MPATCYGWFDPQLHFSGDARVGALGWVPAPITMNLAQSLLALAALIAASAFFSIAEIALAASRRLKLRQLTDVGDARAERVLRIQEQPGYYFTAVQIGLNVIAIVAGIVGDGVLGPVFQRWLER